MQVEWTAYGLHCVVVDRFRTRYRAGSKAILSITMAALDTRLHKSRPDLRLSSVCMNNDISHPSEEASSGVGCKLQRFIAIILRVKTEVLAGWRAFRKLGKQSVWMIFSRDLWIALPFLATFMLSAFGEPWKTPCDLMETRSRVSIKIQLVSKVDSLSYRIRPWRRTEL